MGNSNLYVIGSVLPFVIGIDDGLECGWHGAGFDNYMTTFASKYTNEACKNERSDGKLRRFLYPRRESNPDLRFRKPPFYPLNYKGLRLL